MPESCRICGEPMLHAAAGAVILSKPAAGTGRQLTLPGQAFEPLPFGVSVAAARWRDLARARFTHLWIGGMSTIDPPGTRAAIRAIRMVRKMFMQPLLHTAQFR